MTRAEYARLLVVYDADGSLIGEVSYIVGHALGLRECAACDITHQPFSLRGKPEGGWEKKDWRDAKERLGLPVVQLHRDELDGTRAATLLGSGRGAGGRMRAAVALPVVAGEREDGGVDVLVTAAELHECKGEVAALESKIRTALDEKLPPVTACPMRKRKTTQSKGRNEAAPADADPRNAGKEAVVLPHGDEGSALPVSRPLRLAMFLVVLAVIMLFLWFPQRAKSR